MSIKEVNARKRRKMAIKKTVNFKICFLTCVISFVIILGALTTVFIDCHIDNSFSLRSDITSYHDLYYETKDLKILQELENYLQLNQMPYKIKNSKLSTELFDFDVTDTNNIKQLIKSDFAKSFNEVDTRSANAKVAVDFKDGKMIEKIKYNFVEKENLRYYQDLHDLFESFIFIIIITGIVMFIVVLVFGTNITYRKKIKRKNCLNKEEHS